MCMTMRITYTHTQKINEQSLSICNIQRHSSLYCGDIWGAEWWLLTKLGYGNCFLSWHTNTAHTHVRALVSGCYLASKLTTTSCWVPIFCCHSCCCCSTARLLIVCQLVSLACHKFTHYRWCSPRCRCQH